MTDIVDLAQALEAGSVADATARVRSELRRPGSDVCIACAEPIDPVRRAAAPFARRCINCASAEEPRRRLARERGRSPGQRIMDVARVVGRTGGVA